MHVTRKQYEDGDWVNEFGGDLWNESKRVRSLFENTEATEYLGTEYIGTGLYCTVQALINGIKRDVYLSDMGFARLDR